MVNCCSAVCAVLVVVLALCINSVYVPLSTFRYVMSTSSSLYLFNFYCLLCDVSFLLVCLLACLSACLLAAAYCLLATYLLSARRGTAVLCQLPNQIA
jgi:hypothetical protein